MSAASATCPAPAGKREHWPARASNVLVIVATLAAACVAPGSSGGSPARSVASDTIIVMAYNIHHGEGMDSVVDLERIARMIADQRPHLVAIQEVDSATERTGRVDQTARLAELTGLEAAFGQFMPYQGGGYGMAVLSRLPILAVDNLRLPDGDEPRTALAIRVRTPRAGLELRFIGIHFYRTETERLAQAATLFELISGDNTPVILAGDFNSEPGTAVIESLAQQFRVMDKADDALTFPSWAPEREIDFFMVRPDSRFEVLEHYLLDEPVVSDHRALIARIVIRR
jgi:endonuclease/exonuclease/phosphatase family metal-dependent hydrolase